MDVKADGNNAIVTAMELITVPIFMDGVRETSIGITGVQVVCECDGGGSVSYEITSPIAIEWYRVGQRVHIRFPTVPL